MNPELILTNARLILDDEVLDGTVCIRDGRIADLAPGRSSAAGAEDLDGDYLIPGLVELHTDHVEAHAYPRPGVGWPMMPALLSHDAAIACAGITTVFDAVAIGNAVGKDNRRDLGERVVAALDRAAAGDLLRAEHPVHLRCEIAMPGVCDEFERLCEHPKLRLVSVMDHTPGQRQFVDMDRYREYHTGKYGISEADLERQIDERQALHAEHAAPQRSRITAWCRQHGLTLASHDDATDDHVQQAATEGVTIAEFPTTPTAARAAHGRGMRTILGAPNMVRGGSHSGNVAAADLARDGLLDAFSSDYVPSSLLDAAWRLTGVGFDLPAAVATVRGNPARMLGLEDRGHLRTGRRADLVRVHGAPHGPVVRRVWRTGRTVA